MQTLVISFVAAAVLSALFTPLARVIAFKFGIVSTPGGRHINGRTIPRMGGLGIYLAVTGTMLGLYLTGRTASTLGSREMQLGFGLQLGGALMFLTGLADDVKGIRAIYKLLLQVLAATVAWSFGFRIDVIDLPLLGQFSMGAASLPITVFWIVGIINAINLIDGLDGLAAGVVFFAAATNLVVATLMGTPFVAIVMSTLAGAVLGFLFYNFNPARIFMGDSGSYFLGFILAVCSIAGPLQKASAAISIAVPIVALGVPIIDTLLAMVRRFLEKRPIFSSDRGHIHHRLLDMGITHRRAVLIIYGVTVALCVGAIGIAFGRSWEVGAAILAVSALMFGLIRSIGYFEYLAVAVRQKQRIRSRHVEWLRKVIMLLPNRFEQTTSERAAFDVLQWLAREARLDCIELTLEASKGEKIIHKWLGDDYRDMDVRDVSSAKFPLGTPGSGYHLKFRWRSEYGDVAPQMDILLQLVLDQTQETLRRVKSVYVPELPPAAELQAATSPATNGSLVHHGQPLR